MDTPSPTATTQSDTPSTETTAAVLTRDGEGPLLVETSSETGRGTNYSILVRGEIQASSILSDNAPAATITLFEDDTTLVSGSVAGGTAGFVLDGQVLAAAFDGAEPTVTVDGATVEPGRWPTVAAYTGHGPAQEPVEDPFPNSGELGASPDDPLNPDEYVLELDASGLEAADAYCFDVDGDVVDHSDGVTVSDSGTRVYGCLQPEASARIDVRGVITRIDTADGIDFAVRTRDGEQSGA